MNNMSINFHPVAVPRRAEKNPEEEAMSTIQPTLPTAARTGLQTFAIDPDHSEVGFSVRHLLSRTRGRFARFEGAIQLDREHPEASRVRFQVDPASIDTRQPDRDTHLRSGDFFDVASHPAIVFESTAVRALGGARFQVDGTLELRGYRRAI